jgi:hypothetical protein
MARIAIDAALGSGFGLIRRRPGSVLLWGLIQVAVMAATFGVFGSFYFNLFARVAAEGRLGADASAQAMSSLMPQMMAMQGWTWLLNLVSAFVGAVLYCAAFRAILHPEETRFGYLRVGTPELMLVVLTIGAYIVFFVALLVGVLVVALVVAALAVMHAVVAGTILAVLAGVAAFVAVVWVALRFSMVGPMMVGDGKFHLFESWTLTRGHVGALLIVAVCLIAILIIGEMVLMGVLMVAGAAILASAAGGLANLSTFFSQPPSAVLAGVAPLLILAAALFIPLTGCVFAIWGAPWARAYLDLTTPAPEAPVAV